MNEGVRTLLENPFSEGQIKQRVGNFGQMLDYIEGHEVIQRLNDAFEADWSFQITWQSIQEQEVFVLGRLTIAGITKEQFGSSKITRNRDDNSVISLGDDLKSAATDALKKCATLLGVGLHLYRNGQQPARNNNGCSDRGNGNGRNHNGNGRATEKQLNAIFVIAGDKGMNNKDVRNLCVDTFGKVPDYLNKEEASTIIKDLSAR